MVELSKVMGTVLKDLAHSRVISDSFSRDVSVEYEKDPILRLFPVPRIEIKEVTVSLPFTIKNVDQATVKKDRVIKDILRSEATKLTDQVFKAIVLRHKNREAILKILDESQFKKRLQNSLEQQLSSNVKKIEKALESERAELNALFSETIRKELFVNPNVARELLVGTNEANFTETLRRTGDTLIKNILVKDAQVAIDAALEKAAAKVDVGVTADELAGVPEAMITKITVVADIRNYQWTQVEEVEGKPVRNLVPQ